MDSVEPVEISGHTEIWPPHNQEMMSDICSSGSMLGDLADKGFLHQLAGDDSAARWNARRWRATTRPKE